MTFLAPAALLFGIASGLFLRVQAIGFITFAAAIAYVWYTYSAGAPAMEIAFGGLVMWVCLTGGYFVGMVGLAFLPLMFRPRPAEPETPPPQPADSRS